jgi:dATP pyrophosphohydrolase
VRTHEVFVVVRRGDQFLVLHRSERQGGYWHGVAGGVEPGESAADAAARELREETGLAATPRDLQRRFVYALQSWETGYAPDRPPITVDCFLVEAAAGWEPVLDWEHDGYRWCSLEEAEALLFWPESRQLLREVAA